MHEGAGRLAISLPYTLEEIASEIAEMTGCTAAEALVRLNREAEALGANVAVDVERYGVTPHHFNRQMERLYSEGDGFIYETMYFWREAQRQAWIASAIARLALHGQRVGRDPCELRVLVLGDGTGSDSLLLASRGFSVDYFDIPGSRTYEFALRRFQSRGALDRRIRVLSSYEDCRSRRYDAIIFFEVLEHLQDPISSIADVAAMLVDGGIALVTESCALIEPRFPTHLAQNRRLARVIPFLFLRHSLHMSWFASEPLFRPTEYRKAGASRAMGLLRLATNRHVARRWLSR